VKSRLFQASLAGFRAQHHYFQHHALPHHRALWLWGPRDSPQRVVTARTVLGTRYLGVFRPAAYHLPHLTVGSTPPQSYYHMLLHFQLPNLRNLRQISWESFGPSNVFNVFSFLITKILFQVPHAKQSIPLHNNHHPDPDLGVPGLHSNLLHLQTHPHRSHYPALSCYSLHVTGRIPLLRKVISIITGYIDLRWSCTKCFNLRRRCSLSTLLSTLLFSSAGKQKSS